MYDLHSTACSKNAGVMVGLGLLVILFTTGSCSLGRCNMIGMEESVILQLVELILQLFLSTVPPLLD